MARTIKSDYIALMKQETFTRTASGRNWKKNPDTIEKTVFTSDTYNNFWSREWSSFFRNTSAYYREVFTYECAGYIPTRCTAISPDRTKKVVTTFIIVDATEMKNNGGWRENEILKNAETWEIEYYHTTSAKGYYMNARRYTFITSDTGVTHSGTFDTASNNWVD